MNRTTARNHDVWKLAAATLVLTSCAETPNESVAADEEAIQAVADAWTAAYSAGDFDALMELYSDDAVDIPPGQKSEGKAAIRERQVRGLEGYRASSALSFDEVIVSGDWAFARGVYEATYTDLVDGTEAEARNDNLWVLRKDSGGAWRIARMMYNPAE